MVYKFSNAYDARKFFLTHDFFHVFFSRFISPFLIPELFKVKNFSSNIDSFLYIKLSNSFKSLNVNILRNIFLKSVYDIEMWKDIEFMFNSGIIGLSGDYIYQKDFLLNSSFLSIFLLELYYSELDNYISSLSLQYNSVKSFIFGYDFPPSDLINFSISRNSSLRLEKSLYSFCSIQSLNRYKNLISNNEFRMFFSKEKALFFSRKIDFIRYKDRLICLIEGSKDFVHLFYNKFHSFLRSNLLVSVHNSRVIPLLSENIHLLGFNKYFKA